MAFGLHVDVYTRAYVPPHMHGHTYMSYRYNSETEQLSSMCEVVGSIPSAKRGGYKEAKAEKMIIYYVT